MENTLKERIKTINKEDRVRLNLYDGEFIAIQKALKGEKLNPEEADFVEILKKYEIVRKSKADKLQEENERLNAEIEALKTGVKSA